MKKLMLLAAAAALFTTGCGRQWWNNYGCGETPSYGYAMGDACCNSCCDDGAFAGYGVSPGFTTGYVPASPAQVLPGPEIVPAPAR